MALPPGTRLGLYEIVSALGAGGMGEVYRARDTKLGREVAIKVVGESFTHDPDRIARFRGEAQLLAALNHPHIATIYGLEETAGGQFLVMELVEGETLAERLRAGPLPVAEALRIARQVADALQAAHEKGIIHRDLKPANIALTAEGQVKVLDFGLAKALEAASAGDVSASPTLSLAATQAGVILGTAAYMAPEQARGKPADKRSDIWAFGCVLYEMLAGKRAFDGEDIAVVLAAVIKGEPDWTALPSDVPTPVATLLRGCLEKERRSRIADIAVALFVLDEVGRVPRSGPADPTGAIQPAAVPRLPLWRRASPAAAGLVIGALVAGGGTWVLTRPSTPAVVRTTLVTAGPAALALQGQDRDLAITPDGTRIIYRGTNQLFIRALNQLTPAVVGGLNLPRGVFVSPDGQWVGFFDGSNTLKKVAITGGSPVTIAQKDATGARGATWGPDGTIVFATNSPVTGLLSVPAAGGSQTVLTKPDREHGEGYHYWPEFLPGGQAVLFTIVPLNDAIENSTIAVLDLRTKTSKVLIRGGSHASYVPTGHLIYGANGTLRAVGFDLERLEVTGTPAPALEGVVTTISGATEAVIASNGTLAYVAGTAGLGGGPQTIAAVDRQGRASTISGIPPDTYRDIRVSPDGLRLALATQGDVWTYDFARATLTRLTTHPGADTRPLWTPDGRRIIFSSYREGPPVMFWRSADGTGNDERLLSRGNLIDLRGSGWSPDGRSLLFIEVSPRLQCSINQMELDRPADIKVLLKNDFCNNWAAVSPNGRWIAYESNSSGQDEIYVERYPELGNRQQISTGGGRSPIWSRDGGELFFMSLNARQIVGVSVQSGATLVAARPQVLFDFPILQPPGGSHPFDLAPDGRFMIIRSGQIEAGSSAPSLVLVQNWTEELKRLVPTN